MRVVFLLGGGDGIRLERRISGSWGRRVLCLVGGGEGTRGSLEIECGLRRIGGRGWTRTAGVASDDGIRGSML